MVLAGDETILSFGVCQVNFIFGEISLFSLFMTSAFIFSVVLIKGFAEKKTFLFFNDRYIVFALS